MLMCRGKLADGIVLLMIGLGMLNGTGSTAHTGTPAEQEHQAAQDDVSLYPMAFPMIVGPGSIVTLVLLSGIGDVGTVQMIVAGMLTVFPGLA